MSGTGLTQIGDGVFAYLQVGSWGYSNAGLIESRGSTLLVDTLYDLALTRRMLDEIQRIAPRIDSVVNTHANGDHCWGNQLVGEARVISSRAAAEEMKLLPPKLMHGLVQASRLLLKAGPVLQGPMRLLGRLGVRRAGALADAAALLVERFGPFDFGAISLRLPDTTFEGRFVLQVGDKEVHIIEVGPAHTKGDVIVYVPTDRVVYTGDILFIGSHPIVWDGPIDNWIRACDTILGLDVDVVVPGHGPLTTKLGVQQTKDYWRRVKELVAETEAARLSAEHAVEQLLREHPWNEAERVVVNVDTALRELRHTSGPRDPLILLAQMSKLAQRLRAAGQNSG
jgi:glyoxylase-like metal-dependent hydrolase (beta-lactamase superfamily II)